MDCWMFELHLRDLLLLLKYREVLWWNLSHGIEVQSKYRSTVPDEGITTLV